MARVRATSNVDPDPKSNPDPNQVHLEMAWTVLPPLSLRQAYSESEQHKDVRQLGVLHAGDDPGVFGFDARTMTVSERMGSARVTVYRLGHGEGPAVIYFTTQDGTATAGMDYTPQAGRVIFRKGEKTATIKLEIIDDDEVETTEHFFVRLLRIEGGTLASRADLVKIRIKDDDTRLAARLKHAPAYHLIEAVFTIFALVGGELAQRLLEPEYDEWVGHITLTCFFFFAFDMLLLHKSEPSYGFSSREFLDAIATIVLLPAVPAFYRHVAPVLGIAVTNFLTQGTAARASRAARVGSRAGRLIKHVTYIVEAVATFFASRSKALKNYLKEKKRARKSKKRAKKAAEEAAAARAARAARAAAGVSGGWGGLQKKGTHQRLALSIATEQSRNAREPKRISEILREGRWQRSDGGSLHSAEEDQARAVAARKHADRDAKKQAQGKKSHVGVQVLELFVSKITLMVRPNPNPDPDY